MNGAFPEAELTAWKDGQRQARGSGQGGTISRFWDWFSGYDPPVLPNDSPERRRLSRASGTAPKRKAAGWNAAAK